MIEVDLLQFGYGDIGVSYDSLGRLVLFELDAEYECGTKNCERKDSGVCISISLNYDEYKTLDNFLLGIIKGTSKIFNFKEYTWDFSNYNINSINVIRDNANKAINRYLAFSAA